MKDYVEHRDGGYWITGKRVSLDSVVYAYRRGQPPESIQQSFPTLSFEEVYGAIAFYLSNQETVDRSILKDEVEFQSVRAQAMKDDRAWYEKMNRARERMLVSKG